MVSTKKRFVEILLSALTFAEMLFAVGMRGNNYSNSRADSNAYSLHINTKNPVVSSQVENDSGYVIWTKADSSSGVNFSYSQSSFSISKGGYIQNLSKLNGIYSVKVTLSSGSLSLFYLWEEPKDLESAEYETGYTFTSSGTYTFTDVNPSHIRLKANADSVVQDICVNYSCNGSIDQNTEDISYGLENGLFDAGALNTYGNISFVTGEGNTSSKESKRALKVTFDNTRYNYISLDTAHDASAHLLDGTPNFSNKLLTFKAKCSEDITEKSFEVCAVGSLDSWTDSSYVTAAQTGADENGWISYSVDFSSIPFANNNDIIRINIKPKGIVSSNKQTASVIFDDIRYEVAQKSRHYRSETISDSLENMSHDTGWENLNHSYSVEETYGFDSTSSLRISQLKSGKSKDNSYKYFTSFTFAENKNKAFVDVPDLSTGYLSFNYKPLFVKEPSTGYFGVLFDWNTNAAKSTFNGKYLFNGWYSATINLANYETTATEEGAIRLNLGWDIDSTCLDKAVIYIDNLKYSNSSETYTQSLENLPRDTGWERCFYEVDRTNVASLTSTSSGRMTFSGKERKDTNELGCIFSPQTLSIESQFDFTSGVLEAKFMFSKEITNKLVRVLFVDEAWASIRYNVMPMSLNNGWYLLRMNLSDYELSGSYTGHNIIRFGFGFFGVTDEVKSSATVWIDDVSYTNTSYSALSSYTNATFYQSYETENYLNTAKAVSNRTISSSNPLKFSGLKNDVESNQFVIKMKSGKSISSYNFKMESLRDSQGHILDSGCFEILVPQYISISNKSAEHNNSSYGWQGVGNYPDALLPIDKVIEEGNNKISSRTSTLYGGYQQSIWINCNIPKYIKAGKYTGRGVLTIGTTNYEVPIEVNVYGATLSEEEHNKTCFLIWWDQLNYGEGSNLGKDYRRLYYDYLVNKRISPGGVRENDYFESAEEFADFFAENIAFNKKISTYRLPFNTGTTLEYTTAYDWLNELITKNIQLVNEGQNVNFFDKLVLYYHDEPSTTEQWANVEITKNVFNRAKSALAPRLNLYPELKESFLDIRNVTTFNQSYSSSNNEKLDVPCPTFEHLDTQTEVQSYIDGHEYTWWYGCILPTLPYVSYHIDSRLIGSRMHTWLQYGLGVEGEIYFCVDYNQRKDPGGEAYTVDPYTDPFCEGYGAGDGRLVYPGMPKGINGPVSSMRLEEIRASMEDYEYFYMIDQRIDKYNQLHGTNYTSIKEKLVADYLPSMFNGTKIQTSLTSEMFDTYRLQILAIVDELY